jgi:hypothetical protein
LLLTRYAATPVRALYATDLAFNVATLNWADRQVRAYTAIENRCCPNAQDLIDGLTEVAPIIAILETNYRPSGAGMANELCRKFYNMRLADWKNVNEYTE